MLDDRPSAYGRFETEVAEDPFAIPMHQKIGDLLAADRAMNAVKGIAWTESVYSAQREWKTFAATDGSYTEQVITHLGAGLEANAIDGDEHQRRSYPDNGGSWASAGYEFVRGMDLLGQRGARRERGGRAAQRAAAARRDADDHPPPQPAVHAGPRELRPPDRAGPGPRLRGQLRGHELPDAGHAGRLPLRLGPVRHRGRRDRAGRARDVRLGRRGGRRAAGADHQGGDLRRLPELPGDGAADRAGLRRGDARRRLEPDPADPDDQRQPAARSPG